LYLTGLRRPPPKVPPAVPNQVTEVRTAVTPATVDLSLGWRNNDMAEVMRFRVALAFACFCCCLAGSGFAFAVAADESAQSSVRATARYPDEGLLSNYRYANAFFGFSVDLPADAALRPIPSSNPTDGSIALLETIGSAPEHCVMAISAYPSPEKRPDARLLLRHELDDELSIGVEELHGLTKTSIAGHPFFYFETRRGIDQHSIYATDLNGYVLRFVAAGRDGKLVQQLEAAVTHMRFFPPESIEDFAGVGARPYNGPAIPYHVIEQLKSDPPANKLEGGGVLGNVYENRALGFGYELPRGWHYGTEAAVMPAVERGRDHDMGKPAVSANQRTLLKSCERTLISAWRKMPEATGEIAYQDFGEVTISAMSLACFPNVKFPDLKTGKDSLSDFVVAYALGHPIIQDMKGARAFERDGRTFLLMDGTVAYHVDGDDLSRRVSVALALTKHRGYVLSFFFAAPHESELRQLMNANARFDPEPALEAASANTPGGEGKLQPGGSVAAATSAGASAAPQQAAATSPADSTTSANTAANPASQPDSSKQTSNTQSVSAYHPSLLKPGESMQDQQMKGSSPSKKKQ
jgi:hypothetical protein